MKIRYKTKPRVPTIENVRDGDYIILNSSGLENTLSSSVFKLHHPKVDCTTLLWRGDRFVNNLNLGWAIDSSNFKLVTKQEAEDFMRKHNKTLSNED